MEKSIMAIAHWEPFKEVVRVQDELNRFFGDRRWFLRSQRGEELGSAFLPAIDIYEDPEALTLTAELPGIDPKDVDLHIENSVLNIKGERKMEREDKGDKKEGYLRIERAYGTFVRSFTLPTTVDAEKAKAEFKNGLLRITIPRREESKPRSIRVEVDSPRDR
jgi:HSP20 family protein